MTSQRTWKIRDQMPDGSWGPEREVTLSQYLAENAERATRAKAIFAAARKTVGDRDTQSASTAPV